MNNLRFFQLLQSFSSHPIRIVHYYSIYEHFKYVFYTIMFLEVSQNKIKKKTDL